MYFKITSCSQFSRVIQVVRYSIIIQKAKATNSIFLNQKLKAQILFSRSKAIPKPEARVSSYGFPTLV